MDGSADRSDARWMVDDAYVRFEREIAALERAAADRREWARLAVAIVEVVMQHQRRLIEKQRATLEASRAVGSMDDIRHLREDAKAAAAYIDRLVELYRRIQTRL